MALPETKTEKSYQGNGSTTTAYPIPFFFLENDHIQVWRDGVQMDSADFIPFGENIRDPGLRGFRTVEAIPATSTVTVLMAIPMDQPFQFAEGDPLPAANLEGVEDYQGLQIQRIWCELQRAFRAPPGETPAGGPFVSYLPQPEKNLSERATGARNVNAWHFAGNLNGDDPNFLATAAACGPFEVGQVWAVEVATKEPGDIQPGPDGQFGTPDDVFVPGDPPTVITDAEGTEVQLRSTQFYVVLAASPVWTWRKMAVLPLQLIQAEALTAPPHSYDCTWNVNPQKCTCPTHGGGAGPRPGPGGPI